MNQSALKAATEGANRVVMRHLDEARDRILMGYFSHFRLYILYYGFFSPARLRGKLPDEDTNRNTGFSLVY